MRVSGTTAIASGQDSRKSKWRQKQRASDEKRKPQENGDGDVGTEKFVHDGCLLLPRHPQRSRETAKMPNRSEAGHVAMRCLTIARGHAKQGRTPPIQPSMSS